MKRKIYLIGSRNVVEKCKISYFSKNGTGNRHVRFNPIKYFYELLKKLWAYGILKNFNIVKNFNTGFFF